MNNNLDRRDFLKVIGSSAAGMGTLALSSPKVKAGLKKTVPSMRMRIGSALRIQPALVYNIRKRIEATSWRGWGGLKSQNDVNNELKRI